ncbi:C6 transcription factor GliZ-like, putative [Talaromyces stipitatus ATCC 10500]|uniref:C6 transcription factor GliZ-like, putative n=1 Tax=Talaromyces stipitatus (strain ATCC 10500 / CBS 375.48 / QM 6759 / NRRL 1006) TaxID=441959 RepID=B8M7L3_TALSN|nr:C6 transcription factor GliZ-like, putative [Talaromyces stipitatus ATCC 10500]EED19566.1 C6 transcription factor GliZ-like, putative [Talaromyces stipitatus ATCC 10500]
MHSLDETGKPRYRAACDACRQSKVRCSGGGVCVRCKKHDYKCRYSIAHRAGKPKGSKNKATLKKLENLQAVQQGKIALSSGMGIVSTGKISRPLANPEFSQQRRKNASTHDIRARYDLGHPSLVHMRHSSHPMSRKYAFAGPALPMYPSPTSPGTEPNLWQGVTPSTQMGFYDPLEPIYGHIPSPAIAPYLPSPSEESATAFSIPSDPSTIANVCSCANRLDSSQRQLSSLDSDITMWRFDPTMGMVSNSLSSCHIFLSCAACPKSTYSGGELWILISLLDRTFDVLNHLVFHRNDRNNHGLWPEQQQQYGQIIPFTYAVALQDCILEQSVATSYQIVRALRETIDAEIGITGGVLGDINLNNNGLSSSSSSSSTGFPSPASMEAPVQELILRSDHPQQTCKTDKTKSCNASSSSDINFILQAIQRYEAVIGSMQAVITRNSAAAAATTQASSASWSIGISDIVTSPCGPYQLGTMEGFPQQPHPGHARFASYDMIGLS